MTISTRVLKSGHWGPLTILFAAVLLAASPLIAAVDEEIEVISYPGVSDDIYNPQAAASWGCGFVVAYNAHVQDENHVLTISTGAVVSRPMRRLWTCPSRSMRFRVI